MPTIQTEKNKQKEKTKPKKELKQLEFTASQELLIDSIQPSQLNPRTEFDRAQLDELKQNIKERGIIQPITVRPLPNKEEKYEIVVGERRWRAAQELGFIHIPAIIRELTDSDVLEMALIENIQRRDLTDVEKGRAIRQVILDTGATQREISKAIGVSFVEVNRWVALATRLDPDVQEMIAPSDMTKVKPTGTIESRTGSIIASAIKQPERQREVAQAIVSTGIRGQEARTFVRQVQNPEVNIQEVAARVVAKAAQNKEAPHVQIAFTRKEQNMINSGKKTTIIMPHLRPGLAENGFIDMCLQTDSLPIKGLYRKRYGTLQDSDAAREGFDTIEEFKEDFERKHGNIGEDEQVVIVQFSSE